MSLGRETRPAPWREVIAMSVAKAIFTTLLVAYLLSTSLLESGRSKW